MKYINGKYMFENKPHRKLWIYGDDGMWMHYCTDGYRERVAKLKYKHPTGWKCVNFGQYFTAEFPDGGRKNVFLNDLVEYR